MAVSLNKKRKKKPWCVEFYRDGKRVARTYCRTKSEADALDKSWCAEKATGIKLTIDLSRSPRFRDFVENVWIEHYKQGAEVPTWEKRLAELRNHAYPVFGEKRLAAISAGDILAFQNRMKGLRLRGRPLASQTIANARSAVSVVFEFAKASRIVSSNPVDAMGRSEKKLPIRATAMTVWTEDEVRKFLQYVAKTHAQAYVAYQVLIQTGMRPSEMRGLNREQIDFDAGTIRIDRQWGQREGKVVDRVKAGSKRTIAMNPKLAALLKTYCRTLLPSARLFPQMTGDLLWGKRREWMLAAGVRVIRNHDFRHTVAVAIYREGMRRGDSDIVKKIANLLGHRKLAQTYHYLDGLLKLDGPNDAATTLTWGDEVDDEFIVAAAGRAASGGETPSTESEPSEPVAEELETPLAAVYPIAIGRPRRALKSSAAITLKSPSNGAVVAEGGTKK